MDLPALLYLIPPPFLESAKYQPSKLTRHSVTDAHPKTYKGPSARDSNSDSSSAAVAGTAAELQRVVDAWPELSAPVRAGIQAMVEAAIADLKSDKPADYRAAYESGG
ncbi:MAG: hypothetical protein KKI02_00055 [Planctomycetes bacterium]|nr:hypothetical protein [Planctomycetota bacterium]